MNAREARLVADGLRRAGLDVWWAERDGAMQPGRPFSEQLEEALQRSEGLAVLVGGRGVDGWVRAEVDYALSRHAADAAYRLFPLILRGGEIGKLPPFLARFHAIELPPDVEGLSPARWLEVATALGDPPQATGRNPFPGLRSFDEGDASLFFGRDREIVTICSLLGSTSAGDRRWLQMEGASGAGKSSLARAGVVPALRHGWSSGDAPRRWFVAVMRPGRSPVRRLARELHKELPWRGEAPPLTTLETRLRTSPDALRDVVEETLGADARFLLVIDQFEEIFTLAEPGDIPIMLGLLDRTLSVDGPVHLLTVIRADFLDRLAGLPFGEHLNSASRFVVGPLRGDKLREAVEAPARLAGLRFEGELVSHLLAEAPAGEAALPLVASVLRELWHRRSGTLLTYKAYGAIGGVTGALTRGASAVIDALTPEERDDAHRLLVALVKPGRGGPDTRRSLTHDEVEQLVGGKDRATTLIARLSGAPLPGDPGDSAAAMRLLLVTEERIDLVHESLLSKWSVLSGWIDSERRVLERIDDIRDAVAEFERAKRSDDSLARGARLSHLRGVDLTGAERDRLRRDLPPASREFLERSEIAERDRVWLRQGLSVILLVLMAGFASYFGLNWYFGDTEALMAGFGWGRIEEWRNNASLETEGLPCENSACEKGMIPPASCDPQCLPGVHAGRRLIVVLGADGEAGITLKSAGWFPGVNHASMYADGITVLAGGASVHAFEVTLTDQQGRQERHVCPMERRQGRPVRYGIMTPNFNVFPSPFDHIDERYELDRKHIASISIGLSTRYNPITEENSHGYILNVWGLHRGLLAQKWCQLVSFSHHGEVAKVAKEE